MFSALLQQIVGSPIAPKSEAGRPSLLLWQQVREAAWWITTAQASVSVARLFIVLEPRPRETQIISDLFAGMTYLVAFLAIVNFVLDVPIGGLG